MKKPTELCDIPVDILGNFLEIREQDAVLTIKVKPNSSKEKLSMSDAGELTLSVRSAAIENAANNRVIALLAEIFARPRSSLKIISGQRSRLKRILIRKFFA